MNLLAYIYTLAHPATGEIRYVGLTRNPERRARQYRKHGHTKHLVNWLRSVQYAPVFTVVEVVPLGEADARERWWIDQLRRVGTRLINQTTGGELGCSYDVSVRARIREAALRRIAAGTHPFNDVQVRQRAVDATTKAQRGKSKPWVAAAMARRKASGGYVVSSAHIQRMVEARRRMTPEQREQENNKRKAWWTPERRAAQGARQQARMSCTRL